MASKKVLVVDDESNVRNVYRDILEAEGYEVETASSGEICLKKLEETNGDFGMVVLDVLLPAQTGYDVLDVIRANWPTLAVILVSGKVDKLTREAIDALGAKEFLEKPVTPDILVETVNKHARK